MFSLCTLCCHNVYTSRFVYGIECSLIVFVDVNATFFEYLLLRNVMKMT